MESREQLDREYERFREQQADTGRRDPTLEHWRSLVDRYRTVARDRRDIDADRGLARALWRFSIALYGEREPVDALDPGRQAVAEFDAVLRKRLGWGADEDPAEVDEALAELLVARCDLSEAANAAGEFDEAVATLEDAREVGGNIIKEAGGGLSAGPRSLRALGTVHHNLAVIELNRVYDGIRRGRPWTDLMTPTLMASRALEIRRKVLTPLEPLTIWEFVNTCVRYLRCLGLIGDPERALSLVSQVVKLMVWFPQGTSADLRPHLLTEVSLLADTYPVYARAFEQALADGGLSLRNRDLPES